jgi:hypothetical protein
MKNDHTRSVAYAGTKLGGMMTINDIKMKKKQKKTTRNEHRHKCRTDQRQNPHEKHTNKKKMPIILLPIIVHIRKAKL